VNGPQRVSGDDSSRVAVLGAGAWGTALAAVLAPRRETCLWARDPEQADAMARARCNSRYLPEVGLPETLRVEADLARAVRSADLLVAAVPVAALRELLMRLQELDATPAALVWLCKGFEPRSGLLPHAVVAEVRGKEASCGVLSGPSFALEVARGLPCALTLASRSNAFARRASDLLHGGRLRVYTGADLVGVEIGGALKNVMAIAVGICDGMGLGQNARAALMTRGLAEMTRLGVALGASAGTFMGLSGAGDLFLTATGDLSRNRRVGLELARGRALPEILSQLGHVAEGVQAAREALRIAVAQGVELPVSEAVVAVLDEGVAPAEAVERLLSRDARSEH